MSTSEYLTNGENFSSFTFNEPTQLQSDLKGEVVQGVTPDPHSPNLAQQSADGMTHRLNNKDALSRKGLAGLVLSSDGGLDTIYNSYSGTDIVAQMLLPNEAPITMGELQTISYSIHRDNFPVRVLGHSAPISFSKGSRMIGGSMIFTVFNNYCFYRLRHFQRAIENTLYPVADMLPPIDIVLTFASEYGVFSKLKIYGATFVDEGGTMSIDDMISESTFTYMARGIQPLTGYVMPEDTGWEGTGGGVSQFF